MMEAATEAVGRLPLAAILVLTALLLVASHEIGFRFAVARRAVARAGADAVSGAPTRGAAQAAAVMSGALAVLALMLAFTFGMAGARFDARRQAVLDEANAIGTTWLRSRFLPSPRADAIEALLRRYLEVRLEASRSADMNELEHAIAESEALQESMWRHATRLSREQPASLPVALLIESLNELIDLHEKRMSFAVRYRIAGGVWLALYLMAFASMAAVGAHARLTGDRALRIALPLVFVLSAAMAVTIDLDRRQNQSLFSVSQDALAALEQRMARSADGADSNE